MLAYPRETVVAEKLHAMVHLGIANSRMKDFFDLWFLSREFKAAQWRAFLARGLALDLALITVVDVIAEFVLPPLVAAREARPLAARWTPGGPWSHG